jgi:hypothetical protein
MGMEAAIDFLKAERARIHGEEATIEIGLNTPWLYVGRPSFAVPEGTVSGAPDQIAALLRRQYALGATHVGVRFRSRSASELIAQIDAFGSEVLPQLDS